MFLVEWAFIVLVNGAIRPIDLVHRYAYVFGVSTAKHDPVMTGVNGSILRTIRATKNDFVRAVETKSVEKQTIY